MHFNGWSIVSECVNLVFRTRTIYFNLNSTNVVDYNNVLIGSFILCEKLSIFSHVDSFLEFLGIYPKKSVIVIFGQEISFQFKFHLVTVSTFFQSFTIEKLLRKKKQPFNFFF